MIIANNEAYHCEGLRMGRSREVTQEETLCQAWPGNGTPRRVPPVATGCNSSNQHPRAETEMCTGLLNA